MAHPLALENSTLDSSRSQATRQEIEKAAQVILADYDQGARSLLKLPGHGQPKKGEIKNQAKKLGWNETKLRKARQFAQAETGYTRRQLDDLCRLLKKHRPLFGTAHIGILVTVAWADGRADLQQRCIEDNWSMSKLEEEVKRLYGNRRHGGRRRDVSDDPGHLLVQIEEMTDRWQRWHEVVTGVRKGRGEKKKVRDKSAQEGRGKEKTVLYKLPQKTQTQIREITSAMKQLHETASEGLEATRNRRRRRAGR